MAGMKAILASLFLAVAFAAGAQNLGLQLAPTSVQAGGTSVLTIGYLDASPSANVSAIGWQLTLPAGVTITTNAGSGPASLVAGKVLSSNGNRFLIAGTNPPNNTALGSVALATVPLLVASGTPPGALSIGLSLVSGASSAGLVVPIAAPATVTLTVLASKYDLNSDGKVDQTDIGIAIAQYLGPAVCGAGDVDGDHACTPADVILVVLAAMGLIH